MTTYIMLRLFALVVLRLIVASLSPWHAALCLPLVASTVSYQSTISVNIKQHASMR